MFLVRCVARPTVNVDSCDARPSFHLFKNQRPQTAFAFVPIFPAVGVLRSPLRAEQRGCAWARIFRARPSIDASLGCRRRCAAFCLLLQLAEPRAYTPNHPDFRGVFFVLYSCRLPAARGVILVRGRRGRTGGAHEGG